MKPIISVDFDGVIHSYTSKWTNAKTISDPPVKNAIQWMLQALEKYDVAIYSSRSKSISGRKAMKHWLKQWFYHLCYFAEDETLIKYVNQFVCMDPWEQEVKYAANRFVKSLKFPWFKPPAIMTIDDRAFCFKGEFPSLDYIKDFKPWNK